MGDCLERGLLCFDMKFYKKDKTIYNVLQFFKIFKIIFLIYKISAPFSVVEAKIHTFNIHIGSASQKYSTLIFIFPFFWITGMC